MMGIQGKSALNLEYEYLPEDRGKEPYKGKTIEE